jgi:hypothetical protein
MKCAPLVHALHGILALRFQADWMPPYGKNDQRDQGSLQVPEGSLRWIKGKAAKI